VRQARKDAELVTSVDSVRAYLKQIGRVALLNAEQKGRPGAADRWTAPWCAGWHLRSTPR
jgi:hypothetical protein